MDAENRLLPEYAKRGVEMQRATELAVAYTYFNMEDPVVGGYTPEKVALRRAICSAYNVDDEVRIIRQGQAMVATQPIPPDVAGHVKDYKGFARHDPSRRARTPRPIRIPRSQRRRLPRSARRRSSGHKDRFGARSDVTPVRRAVAAQPGGGRPQGRVPETEMAGLVQGGARRTAAALGARPQQHGRRLLHAAVLRPERGRG